MAGKAQRIVKGNRSSTPSVGSGKNLTLLEKMLSIYCLYSGNFALKHLLQHGFDSVFKGNV